MPERNHHLDPELLSAYLDDEVGAAERALVEAHLAGCQRCQLELESLQWAVTLLQRLPVLEPPRTFYVTEAMIEPAARPSFWQRWVQQWRPALGGLSAVTAVLLALVLLQDPGTLGQGVGSRSEEAREPAIAAEVAPQEAPVAAPAADEASADTMDAASSDASGAAAPAPAEEVAEEAMVEEGVAEDEAAPLAEAPAEEVGEESAAPAADDSEAARDEGAAGALAESEEEAAQSPREPETESEMSAEMEGTADEPTLENFATDADAVAQAEGEGSESGEAAQVVPFATGSPEMGIAAQAAPSPEPEEAPVADAANGGEEADGGAPTPARLPLSPLRRFGWVMVVVLLGVAVMLFLKQPEQGR